MKSTFSIVSEDSPGVLMRIASLIYRRGYNIESLSVGRTDVPGLSRFTIIIEGVQNLTKEGPFVERWLSLVKVMAPVERRPHILQTAEIFRCRVVDLGSDAITLEVTGDRGKVEACMAALKPYGILETAGSGQVALARTGFEN